MRQDISQWIAHVEAIRPALHTVAQTLTAHGANIERHRQEAQGEIAYRVTFKYPVHNAVVTLRILLADTDSDSDLVITNMTTLPDKKKRHGLGSKTIQSLLAWAHSHNLKEIRAVQVGNPDSQRFWEKNGFKRCPEPNPCSDYIYHT